MQPLLKFCRLTAWEKLHILKTYILLLGIRLGLFLLPFKQLQSLLERLSHKSGATRCRPQGARHVIWSVNVASRYMPGNVKCLARALATQVLMRRRGYTPELRIGVAKTQQGVLEAHAWVELQGQVIMGAVEDLGRYQPMPSL